MSGDSISGNISLFQSEVGGSIPTSPHQFRVLKIGKLDAYRYFREKHYSKSCSPNSFPCYGLFFEGKMYGALAFHIPTSENLRSSILGEENKRGVFELHRLFLEDSAPKNSESWFIGKCLRFLKKEIPAIKAVVTFADKTEGHTGIIYKATNFKSLGQGSSAIFYRDEQGRLRYPRQAVYVNGKRIRKNLTRDEAHERGWTTEKREGKYRYVFYY